MAMLLLKKLLKPPPSSALRFLTSLSTSHLPLPPPTPPHFTPIPVPGEKQRDAQAESVFCSLLYNSVGISYPFLAQQTGTKGDRARDGAMWADSVKRKRKVKMNKHKYKKRRKLLRRKT